MLSQMKVGLEEDRRSLMEHVSLLLSQYHELLTHSLEDKEHYHTEEKLFRYFYYFNFLLLSCPLHRI